MGGTIIRNLYAKNTIEEQPIKFLVINLQTVAKGNN